MRFVTTYLPMIARTLAICAGIAGVIAGALEFVFGSMLVCFDTCPTREVFFSNQEAAITKLVLPASVFALLALIAYLIVCIGMRQANMVLLPILALLIGCAALVGIFQWGQTYLPVSGGAITGDGATGWTDAFGAVLVIVAAGWSWLLVHLARAAQRARVPA